MFSTHKQYSQKCLFLYQNSGSFLIGWQEFWSVLRKSQMNLFKISIKNHNKAFFQFRLKNLI